MFAVLNAYGDLRSEHHAMTTSRRAFLVGLSSSVIAAPAIVRAASLMPVRGIILPVYGSSPAMDALPGLRELQAVRIQWQEYWNELADRSHVSRVEA